MKRDFKPSKEKNNSIHWDSIKDGKIRSFPDSSRCLTAGEFVKRIKKNGPYDDEDVEKSFVILIEACKTDTHDKARVARSILEKAGFNKPIIPKEAYDRNRTDNPQLRHYQLRPGQLVREIERVKFWIDVYLYSSNVKLRQKRKYSDVFYYLFKRGLTLEEMQTLPKKKGFDSIPKLSLFFWACWTGIKYKTLSKLYYSKEAKQERKEIESLNDPYAMTSREKRFFRVSSHSCVLKAGRRILAFPDIVS